MKIACSHVPEMQMRRTGPRCKKAPSASAPSATPRGPPRDPTTGTALARAAPRAQSRPPAQKQLRAPHAPGTAVRRASAPRAARELDQIAPAPSFMYLQCACNSSRQSLRTVRCKKACHLGWSCASAARCRSHLEGLQSARVLDGQTVHKNGSKLRSSSGIWWPVRTRRC